MSFSFQNEGNAYLELEPLLPKLDEIKFYLYAKKSPDHSDILCETFLHKIIEDSALKISTYNFERKDREDKSGCVTIVYPSENLQNKRRHDLEFQEIESI